VGYGIGGQQVPSMSGDMASAGVGGPGDDVMTQSQMGLGGGMAQSRMSQSVTSAAGGGGPGSGLKSRRCNVRGVQADQSPTGGGDQ